MDVKWWVVWLWETQLLMIYNILRGERDKLSVKKVLGSLLEGSASCPGTDGFSGIRRNRWSRSLWRERVFFKCREYWARSWNTKICKRRVILRALQISTVAFLHIYSGSERAGEMKAVTLWLNISVTMKWTSDRTFKYVSVRSVSERMTDSFPEHYDW